MAQPRGGDLHATGRRVVAITDTRLHLGPDLARRMASLGHDLVIGEPLDGLSDELSELGATVAVVEGIEDLSKADAVPKLVARAMDQFGRLDAACIRTGKIITGTILEAELADLDELCQQNIHAVFHALQALVAPMLAAGQGQIVIVTSATGARAEPAASLYSATRAAANMLVKNAAQTVADKNLTINAIGTNYLDYPGFREATGADDPEIRKALEKQVPMRRLGETSEVAHFCSSLLDGKNMFQTGQFFSLSGGWSD